MNDLLTSIGGLIPTKYVPFLALLPLVGRAYNAIKNGGGLRGIWRAIWLGVDTPSQPKDPNIKP